MSSTKTVSFRLPMDEYIKYLQKATSMNLGPADYALLKIYADEKSNEELESLKASYKQLESEHEDFKREVRENYAIEVSKATDELKAKYEAELKLKEVEFKKVNKQLEELANELFQVTIEKKQINDEVAQLQRRLKETADESKLQMQASADATAKEIQKKDAVILDLQSKLEIVKQDNKQLTLDVKNRLQKAQLDYEKETQKIKDKQETETNVKVKKLIAELDKDVNLATSKSFREKWEKRFKEI